MNAALISTHLFDDWIARAWREARRLAALRGTATRAERETRHVAEALRERIARYEHEQPGYASDLRAALARMEHELEDAPRTNARGA